MKNLNKFNKGQVLIEAIVALAVISFVLAGIVAALIAAVNNSTFAKNQNLATNIAQEGIDISRDLKESGFSSFTVDNSTFCLEKNSEGENILRQKSNQSPCLVIGGIFTREIYVDYDSLSGQGSDERGGSPVVKCGSGVFIASTVSWNDSRCEGSESCHVVELNSCFSDLGSSSL
jgi:type II secretory pathway pseudopilin PulG